MSVDAAQRVDHAVQTNTTERAVIARIEADDDYTETFIQVGGTEYLIEDTPPTWNLFQAFAVFDDGPPDYQVGGTVEVALDPDPDPDLNWAYDVKRYDGFSWIQAMLGLAFMISAIAFVRAVLTRSFMLPDGARWQWWRTTHTSRATVVEIRDSAHPWPWVRYARLIGYGLLSLLWDQADHDVLHLVIEIDGRRYFWEVAAEIGTRIEVGTTFHVIGRPHLRGWVVGLTSPKMYPLARLD